MIDPATFNFVWIKFGSYECDLFANRFNTQLDNFVSPFPDNLALATNALTIPWDRWESIYLFPPIPLLDEVVARLASYRGRGVLIAPLFAGATWFPNLLHRARAHVRLPDTLTLS